MSATLSLWQVSDTVIWTNPNSDVSDRHDMTRNKHRKAADEKKTETSTLQFRHEI